MLTFAFVEVSCAIVQQDNQEAGRAMSGSVNVTQADIRLLRVFNTVVECGGFAAAQVELNVGQSTISAHMAALETRLGVRLCERGRAGFRLTDEGRHIYESAQRLFRSVESFRADVEGLRGRLAGELYIGTVDNVVTNPRFSLDSAMRRFKERDGDVRIHLHVGRPSDIERAVVDGSLHVGIGGYTRRISGIAHIPLIRERQQLYCAVRHPLFGVPDAEIDISALSKCQYVKRPYVPDVDIPEYARLNATALAENMEAIAFLVISGKFIGFLPEHYASRWVAIGEMRALLPERMHYESRIELLVRTSTPQPLAVRYFVSDLLSAFECEAGQANGAASLWNPPAGSGREPDRPSAQAQ
jgi:DNA-binding transcriptional LysR family regulator